MSDLTFTKKNITSGLYDGNGGNSFQCFIGEYLARKYGDRLTTFPTAGNDGCIDLVIDDDKRRIFIECKHTQGGKDGFKGLFSALKTKLSNIIIAGDCPLEGREQYEPWYDKENPVTHFWLYTSFDSNIEKTREDYINKLSECIKNLPQKHLKEVIVKIYFWDNIRNGFNPNGKFAMRWFPSCLPTGLKVFPEAKGSNTNKGFSKYLENDNIKYFTPIGHKNNPRHTFTQLEKNESDNGVIIIGPGGIGKTRYIYEIGHIAVENEWFVFLAKRNFNAEIAQLTKWFGDKDKVLILFDYLESQSYFTKIIDNINYVNEKNQRQIHYAANCRNSYFSSINNQLSEYIKVDLTIKDYDYGEQVVKHILTQNDLTDKVDFKVCNNMPILAVFLVYLKDEGRNIDLEELRNSNTFEDWYIKSITRELSLKEKKNLFILIAQYPLTEDSRYNLAGIEDYQLRHTQLVKSGWITDNNESYEFVHDSLADMYLRKSDDYLEDDKRDLVNLIFDLAERLNNLYHEEQSSDEKHNNLVSPVQALERVYSNFIDINWTILIDRRINGKNNHQWQEIRNKLVTSPLIPAKDKLELFQKNEELWLSDMSDTDIQNSLGYIAKQIVNNELEVTESQQKYLVINLQEATEKLGSSNYILNWSFRLQPNTFKEKILNSITNSPTWFQSHYLMVAWLDCELPVKDISEYLRYWCVANVETKQQSFILQKWLNSAYAKEDNLEVVKDLAIKWLEFNGHFKLPQARFVYEAWLQAKGEKLLVEDKIVEWIKNQEEEYLLTESIHLYNAWLNAKGSPSLVREQIIKWFKHEKQYLKSEAKYVYIAWLNSDGDPSVLRKQLVKWLENQDEEYLLTECLTLYEAWLKSKGDINIVEEPITKILKHKKCFLLPNIGHFFFVWIKAGGDKGLIEENIKNWLEFEERHLSSEAIYVYEAWLKAKFDTNIIKEYLTNWFELQEEEYLLTKAHYLFEAWMNAGGDLSLVRTHVINWLRFNNQYLDLEALYVCSAWLKAKGEKALIYKRLIKCLRYDSSLLFDKWLILSSINSVILTDDDYKDLFIKIYELLAENVEHPKATRVFETLLCKWQIFRDNIDGYRITKIGLNILKTTIKNDEPSWGNLWLIIFKFISIQPLKKSDELLETLISLGYNWVALPSQVKKKVWGGVYLSLISSTRLVKEEYYELGVKAIVNDYQNNQILLAVELLSLENYYAPSNEFIEWVENFFSDSEREYSIFEYWNKIHISTQKALEQNSSKQWVKIKTILDIHEPKEKKILENFFKNYQQNDLIRGRILKLAVSLYIVDIGFHAFLDENEASLIPLSKGEKYDLIGKEFEFKIIQINEEEASVHLSRIPILKRDWEKLSVGKLVHGRIKDIKDEGLFIDLGFTTALIPMDKIHRDFNCTNDLLELYQEGNEITATVIKKDVKKSNVLLSLIDEKIKQELQKLSKGDTVKGSVLRFFKQNGSEMGVFIKIGYIDALLHKHDICCNSKFKKQLSNIFKEGQEIETTIMSKNETKNQLNLFLTSRQMCKLSEKFKEQWDQISEGDIVQGQVKSIVEELGVFINLGCIDGLIIIKEIPNINSKEDLSNKFQKDQYLKVMVIEKDDDRGRIVLSLKNVKQLPKNNNEE